MGHARWNGLDYQISFHARDNRIPLIGNLRAFPRDAPSRARIGAVVTPPKGSHENAGKHIYLRGKSGTAKGELE